VHLHHLPQRVQGDDPRQQHRHHARAPAVLVSPVGFGSVKNKSS
jgi:hypothetical protein